MLITKEDLSSPLDDDDDEEATTAIMAMKKKKKQKKDYTKYKYLKLLKKVRT